MSDRLPCSKRHGPIEACFFVLFVVKISGLPCPKGMAPLKRFGVCFESVSGDGFNRLTGSLTDECFVRRLVVF